MNECIKKVWQAASLPHLFSFLSSLCFSSLPSSLPLFFLFFPLLPGCWMPIRFTAFVPMPSRTCRISRCYRYTTTRSKPLPRAPLLRSELYRPCESNTHARCRTHSDTYWAFTIKHEPTQKLFTCRSCVIMQEWNDEVEKRVNLSSSQTHGHTQLLRPDQDQKQHTAHPLFPRSVTQTQTFWLNDCLSFFSVPINKANHTLLSIQTPHCGVYQLWNMQHVE